jgi:hypothetical protein
MRDGLIKIRTFLEPVMANVARGKLESEGIECHLSNENVIRTNILWSQAVGGVGLFVDEKDAERALELLGEEAPPRLAFVRGEKTGAGGKCPSCGSENVYHDRRPSGWTVLFFFLFFLPIPAFQRSFKCAECGHRWKPKLKRQS